MLGLSNAKSALQAYQVREQLAESFCRLIWISGDWNVSDALTKKTSCARRFDSVFQAKHMEIEVWSNLHTEREGSKTDGQSRCQTNARTAGPASCGSWPKKKIELFMYLFMDVLINQPRNAGSSASLTTSFAYGSHNFSHPPSTLDYHSFWIYHSFVSSLTIIWEIHNWFCLEDWGPTSFIFTSALSDHRWYIDSSYCFHGVFLLLLPTHLAIHGLWKLMKVVMRPKWPSPIVSSPWNHIFSCQLRL